jgi:hypothetical protein
MGLLGLLHEYEGEKMKKQNKCFVIFIFVLEPFQPHSISGLYSKL